MYARFALLSAPFATYTWSLPAAFPNDFWRPGLRALVPVGKTLRSAVLLEKMEICDLAPGVKCRDAIFPLELIPLIDAGLLGLAVDLAARQGLAPGHVLGHVLPAGLRKPDARLLWNRQGQKIKLTGRGVAALSETDYRELAADLLAGSAIITPPGQSQAELEICSVAIDPPWPLRPAATRQIAIMDCLYDKGPASRARLLKTLGSGTGAALDKLIALGCVKIDFAEDAPEPAILIPPAAPARELNEEQAQALAKLESALASGEAATMLIYGVTGGGKTVVYLELIRACLKRGQNCMLLAPEVALAHKLERDLAAALPEARRFFYHGYQHPLQRERTFRAVAGHQGACVVIGTRSALFLPLADPACIILDEEHDSSWKQDENLPYHAKELAWYRIKQSRGLLALGSATPDIRTFYATKNGAFPCARIEKRVGGATLPPVSLAILDERAGFSPAEKGLLAPESIEALSECAKKGEQAIILLNRRGYSPLIYCLSCAHTLQCPYCQIGLAFHKKAGRLVCHYCGYTLPWPSPCPECGDTNYMPIGEGTEKIAERLEALAGQPILRLDRDSARRSGSIAEILTGFGEGRSPFLVGTQMLSKGHHFPNVTLVVVADGDIGLNLPDYRAAERTFQLLAQSAGRAGRGSLPGRAIIQTRNPAHYCWQHVINYDYEGFYESELALREKRLYPPFIKLGLLRFSWAATDDDAGKSAKALGIELKREASARGVILLGPAPAPIGMINGRKRMQCLLKAQDWRPMRELWFIASKHEATRRLRIALDLDPVNML